MGTEEAVQTMRLGLNSYHSMDPDKQAVWSTHLMCLFDYADVLRRLNEKGYVADDILRPVIRNLQGIIQTSGGAEWWQQVGPGLTVFDYFESQPRDDVPPLTELMTYFSTNQKPVSVDR